MFENTTTSVSATGNGVTTSFSFGFPVLDDGDLDVYVNGVLKTLTADYTVTLDDYDGGSVVFGTAPTNGHTVLIKRVVDLTQTLNLPVGAALSVEQIEQALDKATMADQQLNEQLGRAVKQSASTSPVLDLVIPAPSANKSIKWNAAGTNLENSDLDPDEAAADAQNSADAAAASASAASTSASTASTAAITASTQAGIATTKAAEAAASAAAVNLPSSLSGKTLNLLRVNAGETAYEHRTPAQVLGDIMPSSPTKGDLLVYNGSAWVKQNVGSNTQVLTADSAQSSGMKWATPSTSGIFGQFSSAYSGRKYPPPGMAHTGEYPIYEDYVYFIPWIGPTRAFTGLCCEVRSPAGTNAVLGVYANANGAPTGAPLRTSSVISTGSNGLKTGTITSYTPTDNNIVWLAVLCDGTPWLSVAGPTWLLSSVFGVNTSTYVFERPVGGYKLSCSYNSGLPTISSLTSSDLVESDMLPILAFTS